ncbi:hypothetical protein A2U01_0010819 [Trifolium medium]|uniref:Uncharacterized protein n=1 Tax=Trifolium medium TaxID=97028 RepID=A0A392MS99_9FABA|nr:hypothetical protein [Trifolium medium]
MISRSLDSNSVWRLNTLRHNHQEVSCKRFFQEGQDWMNSILFHQDFPSESREELAQRLVPEVRELFDFDESLFGADLANGVGSSDNLRLFTLHLRVVVEM